MQFHNFDQNINLNMNFIPFHIKIPALCFTGGSVSESAG